MFGCNFLAGDFGVVKFRKRGVYLSGGNPPAPRVQDTPISVSSRLFVVYSRLRTDIGCYCYEIVFVKLFVERNEAVG